MGEQQYGMTVDAAAVETADLSRPIDPGVRIGHVHLKVADLERALALLLRRARLRADPAVRRRQAAFLSAGGYHHHIGLNTWESLRRPPPPPGTTGLYHVAILYPTRAALADALRRLIAAGIPLDGASDHGVSEALYLRDPDGNGVELYWDRPPDAVAADRRRRAGHVHPAARPRRAAARAGRGTDAGRIHSSRPIREVPP